MNESALGQPIALRDIRKSYGTSRILKGVSLDIEAGSFCTFLGASGSGKSTLLKIIAGFESANAGTVEIGGRDVASVPVRSRNIGMVFQNYALFPNMTVARNIAFGLRTRRVSRSEIARRVDLMLEMIGLTNLGARLPAELSGGQQQRVALARALIIRPGVLLMDEPLGALDRAIRQTLQAQIKDIQRQFGITIVFVTHDQEEALHMSDRIVVMKDGGVEQEGTPRDLYTRPATRFVGGFLGDCNFIQIGEKNYAIRPERMRVGTAAEGLDYEREGVVSSAVFVGPSQKLTILAGDSHFTVTYPLSGADIAMSPGAVTRIGFSIRDASVLQRP